MTAPDLLPCDFCGNDDIQDWGESTWSRPVKWMYCTECRAQGPRVMLERNESEEEWQQRIIAAWNTRATPAALSPEVRALVEAAEPLAAMASRYDPENGDGDLECWSGLAVPKIKHIRALRSALAALREGGGA